VLIFIESGFRRQLTGLIASISVGLAIVCSLILLYEFFWPLVVSAALAGGIYILWENIREMRTWR
jgi:CHASE2 domain-containing sensor protein